MRRGRAVAIAVAVVAGTARAQTGDPSAIADRLFQEGRALEQEERWEEARAKFEDSLRYEPAFGTRLNLAVCHEHLGRLATAWRLYLELHEVAAHARDVERRDLTQRYAKAIEPRVPRLVVVAPAAPPAGFAMTLDGALIAASGAVLRVDAGPHRIEAAAPGFEPVLRTAWLDDNDTKTVVLPALSQTAAHAAAPAPMPGAETAAIPLAPSETRATVALTAGALPMHQQLVFDRAPGR